MNIKRLILTIVAALAVIFVTDMVIHHFWLASDYEATKAIWRPEPEMQTRLHWMFVAEFLWAASFVIIWALGFGGRSVGVGAGFGLLMGAFQAIWVLVNYVLIPLPGNLAIKWFFSSLVQTTLVGIVSALVYKPVSRSNS